MNGSDLGYAAASFFVRLFVAAVLAGVALTLAVMVSGCGASPVRINATANTVATAMLSGAQSAVLARVDSEIATCAGDAACLTAAEARVRPWGTGLDGFRFAVVLHREGVEVAALGGDDDVIRRTLAAAWAVVQREHDAAIRWLQSIGVDVAPLGALPEVE